MRGTNTRTERIRGVPRKPPEHQAVYSTLFPIQHGRGRYKAVVCAHLTGGLGLPTIEPFQPVPAMNCHELPLGVGRRPEACTTCRPVCFVITTPRRGENPHNSLPSNLYKYCNACNKLAVALADSPLRGHYTIALIHRLNPPWWCGCH